MSLLEIFQKLFIIKHHKKTREMMKLSYTTNFARLTLTVLIMVTLLTLGGWVAASNAPLSACQGWPVCVPDGIPGWAILFHRISVALTAVGVLALLAEAWRVHRDHAVILPLSTVSAVLYFALIFTGALLATRGTHSYDRFHTTTVFLFWGVFSAQVLAAGLYSRSPENTYPPLDVRQRLRDFLALSKPIIVLLLLTTTYTGLVMGTGTFPGFSITFWTLLGGGLAAGGASALNQYIDRDLDQLMNRTSKRPLAARRMTPAEGLSFGLAVCLTGIYLMAGFVNFLAALLTLIGALYYVILYSIFLKKATVQNIVIGGGAGAIPPMAGWAAATGNLDAPAWMLFAIVFAWTPPHFWALAIVRARDYAHAGIPMLPVVRGEKETRWQILIYTIGLVGVTLLMPVFGMAGVIYLGAALLFGSGLIYAAWRVYRLEGNKVAWRMYRYSSMYLAFIFLALVIDTVI